MAETSRLDARNIARQQGSEIRRFGTVDISNIGAVEREYGRKKCNLHAPKRIKMEQKNWIKQGFGSFTEFIHNVCKGLKGE